MRVCIRLWRAGQMLKTLEQGVIDKVVADALQTIKNGLPEEAQTVEILQYVIDEMMVEVKGKKIQL